MEFASGGYGQGCRTRCDGFASELEQSNFYLFPGSLPRLSMCSLRGCVEPHGTCGVAPLLGVRAMLEASAEIFERIG